ncbi:ATP-binding protein [Streptomyces sp. LUP47B]|uniref:AAA family ATPase n=1 Tax=Streptomyces sp. LUP47B TaxID=1890286 RepID=UPI001C4077C6
MCRRGRGPHRSGDVGVPCLSVCGNFRIFGAAPQKDGDKDASLSLDFGPATNVLVGENDSGKTAIIDAIRLCLLTTAADFYRITRDECSGAPFGLDFVPLIATDSAEGTHDLVPARRGVNMVELMPGRQHKTLVSESHTHY